MIRQYTSTSIDTTLTATITAVATSMDVASATNLLGGIVLTPGDIFSVAIDPDTTSEEIVYVTAQTSNTLTVTRGEAGTNETTHALGATVRHVLTSDDLNWFNNMIQSADTIGNTPTIDGGTP